MSFKSHRMMPDRTHDPKTWTCCLTHWATHSDVQHVFMRFSASSCVSYLKNLSESWDWNNNLETSSQLFITVSYNFFLNLGFCWLFNHQSCDSISKFIDKHRLEPTTAKPSYCIFTPGASGPAGCHDIIFKSNRRGTQAHQVVCSFKFKLTHHFFLENCWTMNLKSILTEHLNLWKQNLL